MKHSKSYRYDVLRSLFNTGAAFTVQALAPLLKTTETSTSSLIRDLRKPSNGCLDIKGFYPAGSKVFHYRMNPNGAI